MTRHSRHKHRPAWFFLIRRQPSLWNSLLFQIRHWPNTVFFARFDMHSSTSAHTRRNTIMRAVATIFGDIAVGAAVTTACVWIIESAALGLFLSFLVWLIGTLLALAISQFVVHPAAAVLLSDRKLDRAVDGMAGLAGVVAQVSTDLGTGLLSALRISSVLGRIRPA